MAEKQIKILVVGSFVMDLIATAPRVPNMGETVIGTDFVTAPGGKGANQALQCARLGAKVTMMGCVGNDAFGKQLLDTLQSEGVDISHVKISDTRPTAVGNIQIEISPKGTENRILVIPGANYDLRPEDLLWLADEIGSYDMVLLQLEIPMETNQFVAATARSAGVPVMLNPAPAAVLPQDLLSSISYLSPNEHEAAFLCGEKVKTDNLGAIMERLCSRSEANILVTLGTEGSAFLGQDGVLRKAACVRMEHVADPTAAGDSFVAAFCVGITNNLSIEQAMQFAAHTAAITVSRMGAMPAMPTLDEVRALMQERGVVAVL